MWALPLWTNIELHALLRRRGLQMARLFGVKFLVNFCNVCFWAFHSLHLFTVSFVFLSVHLLPCVFGNDILWSDHCHCLFYILWDIYLLNFLYADVAFGIFYCFYVYLPFQVLGGTLGGRRSKYMCLVHYLMHYPECI